MNALVQTDSDQTAAVDQAHWRLDGVLLFRLNDAGTNQDEIMVNLADGSRGTDRRQALGQALLSKLESLSDRTALAGAPHGWRALLRELRDVALDARSCKDQNAPHYVDALVQRAEMVLPRCDAMLGMYSASPAEVRSVGQIVDDLRQSTDDNALCYSAAEMRAVTAQLLAYQQARLADIGAPFSSNADGIPMPLQRAGIAMARALHRLSDEGDEQSKRELLALVEQWNASLMGVIAPEDYSG